MQNYLLWLMTLSGLVMALEHLFPARPRPQPKQLQWSDVLHLVFNGHFFGVLFFSLSTELLLPPLTGLTTAYGWQLQPWTFVAEQGLAVQALSVLFALDFLHWCIHNLLHRVPFLWVFHQIHHTVADDEMSWIVSFRFSWVEPLIYKSLCYFPLAVLGFSAEAIFVHAVVGTLVGHLNHANLSWDYGPFRYLLNSPRMHLHHHDYDAAQSGHNFAIIFSCWDWIFGTARLPEQPPARIGLNSNTPVPAGFLGHCGWPLNRSLQEGKARITGLVLLGLLFGLGALI